MRAAPADDRYAELHAGFRWHVPARLQLRRGLLRALGARAPDAVAIRREHERRRARAPSPTARCGRDADRLAAALRRLGVARGDRVAIVMPQRFETAVAHVALYQLGAVAMPLSMLFGPDALEYRLSDSEARLAIVDESGIATCSRRGRLPGAAHRDRGRRRRRAGRPRLERRACGASARRSTPMRTRADDPRC